MERTLTDSSDLIALLLASRTGLPANIPNIPSIQASVCTWNASYRKCKNKSTNIQTIAPVSVLEYTIPSIKTQPWFSHGIKYIKDINVINPKYNQYETLQVKHLLLTDIRSIDVNREIRQELQNRPYKKGGISRLYAHLQPDDNSIKTNPMLAWEKDLGITFNYLEGIQTRVTTFEALKCVNHWDNFLKMINRSYLVPLKLAKKFP